MQWHLYGRNASLVVAVSGDVDSDTAPALEAALAEAVADRAASVRVDPAGISFVSSAGLGVLLRFYRDHGVQVDRGNLYLDRLIALTGLGVLYGDSEEGAG